MSYMKDLDEYSEQELIGEVMARRLDRLNRNCDYCHHPLNQPIPIYQRSLAHKPTGGSETCRFPDRHRGKVETVIFIDAVHLERQIRWSTDTFGPGDRTEGVLDHIRKELDEIEADPSDASEWADVIILAFDGAWRRGLRPQEILDAIEAKQTKNEGRVWPDWRTAEPGKAIEHDRSAE